MLPEGLGHVQCAGPARARGLQRKRYAPATSRTHTATIGTSPPNGMRGARPAPAQDESSRRTGSRGVDHPGQDGWRGRRTSSTSSSRSRGVTRRVDPRGTGGAALPAHGPRLRRRHRVGRRAAGEGWRRRVTSQSTAQRPAPSARRRTSRRQGEALVVDHRSARRPQPPPFRRRGRDGRGATWVPPAGSARSDTPRCTRTPVARRQEFLHHRHADESASPPAPLSHDGILQRYRTRLSRFPGLRPVQRARPGGRLCRAGREAPNWGCSTTVAARMGPFSHGRKPESGAETCEGPPQSATRAVDRRSPGA